MKRWALLVVALYMVILLLLSGPMIYLAFGFGPGPLSQDQLNKLLYSIYLTAVPWIWAGVFGLAQVAFLVVPVKAISRRPMTRRSVIWPALAAVVLLAIMVVAACNTVMQTIDETPGWGHLGPSDRTTFLMIGIAWFLWAVAMLIWYTRKQKEPLGYMQRLIRFLLAGSILELVIAVPAHVLSRWRNDCCAGFGTFWGLAAGISVALFAFGPAALIYFAKRYSSLRPNVKGDSADTGTAANDAAVAPNESAAENTRS